MTRVVEHLLQAVRGAAVYNPEVQVPPACILWPDRDRQWEAVVPRLRTEMPEFFVLGDYDPEQRTGPAIWLRCVIAGKISEVEPPAGVTPVLYLPNVGRQDLRAVENCPDPLKPLAELQYRGVIWSQYNARDWTILAFLKSDQGGLGLDVAQDNDTRNAVQLALSRLLDEEVALLRGKRLDKDYFNTLLTGGDPVRELLQWLDRGEAFKAGRGENQWRAFVEVCKSQFAFHPEKEGILAGAAKLAAHQGAWHPVWERFCEAPARYPNIPARIRQCRAPDINILWYLDEGFEGWPQWNDSRENDLRRDLSALAGMPPREARLKITELEQRHRGRRKLVWAELGEATLALALEHLAVLAEVTASALAAGTAEDLAAGYRHSAWRADDALVRSLACVKKQEDWEAVCTAIRSVYLPWAEDSARHLQKVVEHSGYPGGFAAAGFVPKPKDGECFLFVDGLRFDVARRLAEILTERGYRVEERLKWAALPTVTATGKPAATPVREKISGGEADTDFEPCVAETGQSLKGGYHLKKLMENAGWSILDGATTGAGQGSAWCEGGNIDQAGHHWGWKLAGQLDNILREIKEQIGGLLAAGWRVVRVVTDHGWLLLPGGLPKVELPGTLAENKWGRCAVLKPGAVTAERLFPWFWNPAVSFALADGIGCYREGVEYTHGGLSLQECLLLELMVTEESSGTSRISVEITDVVWRGLRCTVAVDGEFAGLLLDIRTQPGDPSTSVVLSAKHFKDNGTASVVVENEELEGAEAAVVLLDVSGNRVAQAATIIGG